MSEKKLCVWDVTLDAAAVSQEDLARSLGPLAKKWVFQLEMSESGYKHWQIRLSLWKQKYENSLISLLKESNDFWDPVKTGLSMRVSPTSNPGTTNFNYVMKVDTRLEGPWSDKDVVPERLPRQFKVMVEPLPWQKQAMESLSTWEPRTINVLVDAPGKKGKSTLMGYLHCTRRAFKLPAVKDYKDMLRVVCDIQHCRAMDDRWKAFLIDIPRGFNQQMLHGMFTAIETIKDGYAYDDRYRFKDVWFDSPCVWVFMNEKPEGVKMTADRWKYWEFDGNYLQLTNDQKGYPRALSPMFSY